MAINSVERNDNMNEMRAIKESYEARDKQQRARHRRTIKEMHTKHNDALRKLTEQYNQSADRMRMENKKSISEQERQHIQEIKDLQAAQRYQRAKTLEEHQDNMHTTTQNYEGEIHRLKDGHERTKNRLMSTLNRVSDMKDRKTEELISSHRASSQDALHQQRRKFNKKLDKVQRHNAEFVRNMNDKNNRQMATLRRTHDWEIEDLKVQRDMNQRGMAQKFNDIISEQNASQENNLKEIREGYQIAARDTRDRYTEKAKTLEGKYRENFRNLRKQVANRVNNELKTARRENARLKNPMINGVQALKNRHSIIKKNLTASYNAAIQDLERQRLESKDASHQDYTERVKRIQNEHYQTLNHLNQVFNDKMKGQKAVLERHYDQKLTNVQTRLDQTKQRAAKHTRQLEAMYNYNTLEAQEVHEERLHLARQAFNDRLADQRRALEKNHQKELNTLVKRVGRDNIKQQEKYLLTVERYENQIAKLKAEHLKQDRRKEEMHRKTLNRQLKAVRLEQDAREEKSEQRLELTKENYERDIEQLKNRHQKEREAWAMRAATRKG